MATNCRLGPFRLDPEAEILFRGAEPVGLGQRAVALLRVLVERAGVPVSKDALIEAAWPGLAIEESNLSVQIAALRRVPGEAGGEGWIETLPRRGYRYVGPVAAADHSGGTEIRREALPDKPSIAGSLSRTSAASPSSSPTASVTISSPIYRSCRSCS
jgi:DNA-binding winged helix-turn-helix (wHTH) protein